MDEYMKRYQEAFGDAFPTAPLAWDRTDDEVIEIIQECLKKGKDVYELGYLEDDINMSY